MNGKESFDLGLLPELGPELDLQLILESGSETPASVSCLEPPPLHYVGLTPEERAAIAADPRLLPHLAALSTTPGSFALPTEDIASGIAHVYHRTNVAHLNHMLRTAANQKLTPQGG